MKGLEGMESMESVEGVLKFLATVAGGIAGLYMRMPRAVRLLVLLMMLDYFSGLGAALLGKSPKSGSGTLSSKAGFAGLARKAMILMVVLLATLLDAQIDGSACTGAVTMFYIVNESLSILENAVLLGVPVPQKLLNLLDVARQADHAGSKAGTHSGT